MRFHTAVQEAVQPAEAATKRGAPAGEFAGRYNGSAKNSHGSCIAVNGRPQVAPCTTLVVGGVSANLSAPQYRLTVHK